MDLYHFYWELPSKGFRLDDNSLVALFKFLRKLAFRTVSKFLAYIFILRNSDITFYATFFIGLQLKLKRIINGQSSKMVDLKLRRCDLEVQSLIEIVQKINVCLLLYHFFFVTLIVMDYSLWHLFNRLVGEEQIIVETTNLSCWNFDTIAV